jgi:hypothetical protein
VGEIEVTQVEDNSAMARVLSGQDFNIGDLVRNK